MNKPIILLFALLILAFSGCNPEFDINDKYQDITISYGILNFNDDNHYIKIYKGFLTEDNAFVAASELENTTYCDSIEVKMEEYLNNSLVRTIPLDTTTSVPREPGDFAYPKQILYYTSATLNPQAVYKLIITNKYTGKETYATTPLVGDIQIYTPMPGIELNLTFGGASTISFRVPSNAYSCEIYQHFHYIEVSKSTNEIVKRGVISRHIGNTNVTSTSEFKMGYRINTIYNTIANTLKPDNSVTRYPDGLSCIEYEIWCADKNYSIYVDLNNPGSTSINENGIEHTNFMPQDGTNYGIFSSRNKVNRSYTINSRSQDSLVNGQYTKHLGFRKYHEYQPN